MLTVFGSNHRLVMLLKFLFEQLADRTEGEKCTSLIFMNNFASASIYFPLLSNWKRFSHSSEDKTQLDCLGAFLMIKPIFTLTESMGLKCFCLSLNPVHFNYNFFSKRLGFAHTEVRGSFTIDHRKVRGSPLIRIHDKSETHTDTHICIHIDLYTPMNKCP